MDELFNYSREEEKVLEDEAPWKTKSAAPSHVVQTA